MKLCKILFQFHWKNEAVGVGRFLLLVLFLATNVISFGQDFSYTYEGQTLNYYIDSPIYKTCEVSAYSTTIEGEVTIPEFAIQNNTAYKVVTLRDSAFSGCSSLTSVTIPESVTLIRDYAFRDCSGLTSVTIPETVTSIGGYAFYGCSGLTTVTIPNSVTWIGNKAFYGCTSLSSVHYYSDTPIAGAANVFSEETYEKATLSMTQIGAKKARTYNPWKNFKKIEGSLTHVDRELEYTYEGKTLTYTILDKEAKTCQPKAGTPWQSVDSPAHAGNENISGDLIIPETVKLGNLGYTVTSIPSLAFWGCTNLTSITIPNSVTEIGYEAFYNCSRLESVTIPNSVTEIGDGAFSNCSRLESVTIPNSVTEIGYQAFYGCSGLKSMTIPNSVTEIGDEAFSGCSDLTSVTIPESVTSIGSWVFFNCTCLASVKIPSSVTSIGPSAFKNCGGLTSVAISNSVTEIGYQAFYNCSSLESVTIPNSVTEIGQHAFYGCSGLTSVTIPESVTSIGEWAFYGCNSLTAVYYPAYCPIGREKNIFTEKTYANATLYMTEEGAAIGRFIEPWKNFKRIEAYTPTETREFIYTYGGQTLTYTILDEEAKTCQLKAGFWDLSGNTTAGNKDISGDLIIPEVARYRNDEYTVISIPTCAFFNCNGLTSVTIPNSVTLIGGQAFSLCLSLTSVTIPSSVTHIGDGAFNWCARLTSVTIPSSVTSIGYSAFSNCKSLTLVTIPNSVTSIGASAFYWCDNLTTVTISNSVTSIGEEAFHLCRSLTSVTISNSLTSIEDGTFKGCSGLTSVTIPNSVTLIGNHAFHGCSGLTSMSIPNSVTSIGDYAFDGCSGLTSVTIPNSVTSIGDYAFDGCSGLTSVTIPNSVTSIGDVAFYGCSGLTSVTIPNSVTSIGKVAFRGCNSLTSVRIPSSVASIGDGAFYECSGLTSVYYLSSEPISGNANIFSDEVYVNATLWIPANAATASRNIHPWRNFIKIAFPEFSYTYKGQTLTYTILDEDAKTCEPKAGGRDVYNDYAYAGNGSLSGDLIIPEVAERDEVEYTVIRISNCAFYKCSDLTSVTIPNSVTSIGESAFEGCSGMTSVAIPTSVECIGGRAFRDCSSLTSVTIPNSVIIIGDGAFYWCTGLKSLSIPNSVTSIGKNAFYWCRDLAYVSIPASVTSLGNGSFYECNALVSVYYLADEPINGAADIFSKNCYENATLWMSVNGAKIGQNIHPWKNFRSIAVGEFTYTYEKQTLIYSILDEHAKTCQLKVGGIDTNTGNAYAGNSSISGELIIPEFAKNGSVEYTVIDIPKYAFYDCSGLVSVTIPKSVTSIGEYAFSQCGNLTSVYYGTDEPIEGKANIFSDVTYKEASLYMSEAGLAVGRTIDPWKNFTNAEIYEQSGVKEVVADFDETAPYAVYNLNGIKVGDSIYSLAPGIYIVRQGSKVIKIAMK